jgi:nucleoside-diphosphate-sugar epimerase
MKSVSIMGCGWLGFPLAEYLINKNYSVKGSTTSAEKIYKLLAAGIDAFIITSTPKLNEEVDKFFDSEVLIINIPPGGGDNKTEYHSNQITFIKSVIEKSAIKKVVFVSSTSVYNENNFSVIETDALNPQSTSGKALLSAEQILFNSNKFQTTVLRFGGLIGPGRNPGKFLAGEKNVPGGNTPVNLIHRDDCIEIIYQIIVQNIWGEIFNAASDFHPSKKEFYTKAALSVKLVPPHFNDENINFKIVDSSKLKQRVKYNFIHPDILKTL